MPKSFLAGLHHAARVAVREAERQAREADRLRRRAAVEAARTIKAEQAARVRLQRAEAADLKRYEKELKAAHQAAMQAEAERQNTELEEIEAELTSLLAATLDVDDFVNLETLRTPLSHPPFASKHERPLPTPKPAVHAEKPRIQFPPEPGFVGKLVAGGRHRKAVEAAEAKHRQRLKSWERGRENVNAANEQRRQRHERDEGARLERLAAARRRYEKECFQREVEAQRKDEAITSLINNLAYGDPAAVHEYLSIVLANSVYPVWLPVEHEFTYEATAGELSLKVSVPEPDELGSTKIFRYVKASDEIRETPLAAKARRDRYASVLHQVALRSLHEVFEADRRGLVRTIALQVGTRANDPQTGNLAFLPLVCVGVERDAFSALNLANVVPAETLVYLSANISKDPTKLIAVDPTGVARS